MLVYIWKKCSQTFMTESTGTNSSTRRELSHVRAHNIPGTDAIASTMTRHSRIFPRMRMAFGTRPRVLGTSHLVRAGRQTTGTWGSGGGYNPKKSESPGTRAIRKPGWWPPVGDGHGVQRGAVPWSRPRVLGGGTASVRVRGREC